MRNNFHRRVRAALPFGDLVRLKWCLRLARCRWKRAHSRARFVGVTGSSGKSTTAALLVHILEGEGRVRRRVIDNGFRDIARTLSGVSRKDRYVVVEVAVSVAGHVRAVANILRPDVAIVTLVGIEHYSVHRSREVIAAEKGALVEAVAPGGVAVLNGDDALVRGMAARTRERVVTFGRSAGADYRARPDLPPFPGGLAVDIDSPAGRIAARTNFIGEHFWLSTAAAVAAARELGVAGDVIAERVSTFRPLDGRCRIHETANGPCFILDTVKAPWETLGLAFDMMGAIRGRRKRIVLGQISDYPGNPKSKYRDAYRAAREVADQVIFIGEHSHRSQASAEDRQSGRFREFATPGEVFDYLRADAGRDEVILLKSSTNLHLERIALAFDGGVRCWQPECGVRIDCMSCGLFGHPFAEHGRLRRRRKWLRLLGPLAPRRHRVDGGEPGEGPGHA